MAQLIADVDNALLRAVDAMIADGAFSDHSEAVRRGLDMLVAAHDRRLLGLRITAGYRRRPQTAHELAGLEAATRALIAEERW